MLRAFYWALIALGLYNSATLLVALMRGDGVFAVICGVLAAACLLTAAVVGDEVDGS